jgi:hypothetical protein
MRLHYFSQVILTLTLTVVAVAIAGVAVSEKGGRHFVGSHRIIGLVLLYLLVIQLNAGWLIRTLFDPNRTKRPLRNVAHIGLGIILLFLGFYECFSGFSLYYERPTPVYVLAALSGVVLFVSAPYFGSLGFLVRNRRRGGRTWCRALFGLGRADETLELPLSRDGTPSRQGEKFSNNATDKTEQAGETHRANWKQEVALQPAPPAAVDDRRLRDFDLDKPSSLPYLRDFQLARYFYLCCLGLVEK